MNLFDQAPRSVLVSADEQSGVFTLEAGLFKTFLDRAGDQTKAPFDEKCSTVLSQKIRVFNTDTISSQQLLWKHALRKTRE